MKLVVTDLLPKKQVGESIYIVTTKEEVLKAYREMGVDGIRADNVADISSEEMSAVLDHINQCMIKETEIYMDHKLQMLWEIADCHGEDISVRIDTFLSIIKNCSSLIEKNFEDAEIFCCKSNKDVCNIVAKILQSKGVTFHIHFSRIYDRLSFFINKSNGFLKLLVLSGKNTILIAKLVWYCLYFHKNEGKNSYTFGTAMCSNAIRIYNWLLDTIDEIKKFDSYKILCMECRITYKKLLKLGIEADSMEEWTDWSITCNKLSEYFRLRKEIKKNLDKEYKFQYLGVDFSEVIRNSLTFYLYSDMMEKYKWNIICASYFSHNTYQIIEPWCTSSYPQTRVFYINTEKTKYCRYYGYQMYLNRSWEKWTEIFDISFFSPIGVDVKKVFEKYNIDAKTYYSDIREEQLYRRWYEKKNVTETEYSDNRDKLTLFYAPSGSERYLRTVSDIVEKANMILDYAKYHDVDLICKFHPEDKESDQINEVISKYQHYGNIMFPDATNAAQSYIQRADVVITDTSAIILDGVVDRKPVVCFLSTREYKAIDYLSNNIQMFFDISNLVSCLEQIQERNTFDEWREQRINNQDEIFQGKSIGINRWSKLREMAFETL